MSTVPYRSRRPDIRSNYVTSYFYKDKKFLYSQTHFQNIQVPPSSSFSILDVSENGELAYWEITLDLPTAVPFFKIFGDDETQGFINDLSANGLVAKSRGMCPGDIKLVGGVSPDKAGSIMYNLAYVARYKADNTADALGNTSQVYVIRFYGQLPVPYRRLTLDVQNISSSATLNVVDVYILRTVFAQVPTKNVQPQKAQERQADEEPEQDVVPAQEDEQGYAPPQMDEWIVGGYKPRMPS